MPEYVDIKDFEKIIFRFEHPIQNDTDDHKCCCCHCAKERRNEIMYGGKHNSISMLQEFADSFQTFWSLMISKNIMIIKDVELLENGDIEVKLRLFYSSSSRQAPTEEEHVEIANTLNEKFSKFKRAQSSGYSW